MDSNLNLVIGAIALPAFGQAVLWALHKAGVGVQWDSFVGWLIAVGFAFAVVTLKFYPQYDQVVVGTVTMLYTLITTYQKLVGETVNAVKVKFQ